MCIVSAVMTDWSGGPNKIPGLADYGKLTTWPSTTAPVLPPVIDPKLAQQMVDVLKRLDEIDKKLGNIDCLVEQKAKDQLIDLLLKRAAEKVPS